MVSWHGMKQQQTKTHTKVRGRNRAWLANKEETTTHPSHPWISEKTLSMSVLTRKMPLSPLVLSFVSLPMTRHGATRVCVYPCGLWHDLTIHDSKHGPSSPSLEFESVPRRSKHLLFICTSPVGMTTSETIPSLITLAVSLSIFFSVLLPSHRLYAAHPNSVRGRTGDSADATCRVRVVQSRFVQPGGEKRGTDDRCCSQRWGDFLEESRNEESLIA